MVSQIQKKIEIIIYIQTFSFYMYSMFQIVETLFHNGENMFHNDEINPGVSAFFGNQETLSQIEGNLFQNNETLSHNSEIGRPAGFELIGSSFVFEQALLSLTTTTTTNRLSSSPTTMLWISLPSSQTQPTHVRPLLISQLLVRR